MLYDVSDAYHRTVVLLTTLRYGLERRTTLQPRRYGGAVIRRYGDTTVRRYCDTTVRPRTTYLSVDCPKPTHMFL